MDNQLESFFELRIVWCRIMNFNLKWIFVHGFYLIFNSFIALIPLKTNFQWAIQIPPRPPPLNLTYIVYLL